MAKTSADERRSARANVMLAAALELEGVRIPVRVANLSSHGALILGNALPQQDAAVVFRCNGLSIEGWISWVRPTQAGIQFVEPIEPKEVLRPAPAPCQVITRDSREIDFKRPGFRGRQLSDEEREIVEDWRAS